ncbi:LysR family transcriptional regulator [Amycolatopsis jejuensis]|uniref:LysR family transcriptional regulator n=1 Tax=Amycolatopsis jejuensis TaxID=330084 RepID=UPI00052664CF|nr:LysR family transcriptional regulator [Amycolatopsis jejuensis]
MELRTLRYFVTVAEELHFGRAAERLHIVQPAVSQQVARLERELGVRLLDRSPRTVRLTPAGTRVLAAARDTLAAAERVRLAAGTPSDKVHIGTAPGLLARLERGVEVLRDRHPGFELVLVDLPVADRLTALRRGDLDLVLARGVTEAEGLHVIPAWTEPLHAVVSVRHPAANRGSARLADLAADVLRLPSPATDPFLYDAIKSALDNAGVTVRLGRPTGTVEDTLVELGTTPDTWALLPVDQVTTTSTRVRSLPLDPPLEIAGAVLIPADHDSHGCTALVATAFRDAGEVS